jgi:signal transduction histidine kinase
MSRSAGGNGAPGRRFALGITTKLLVTNLLVFLVFGGVIAVASRSFGRIEDLLSTTVGRDVDHSVENAALLKDLSGVFSEANLVASTFLRDEEGLAARGRRLEAATAALQRRSTNAALRDALSELSRQLAGLVDACARVNDRLRDAERDERRLTETLVALDQLVSDAAVTQILAGQDSVILEQVSALVSAYRETFLQVNALFLRATLAGSAPRGIDPSAELLSCIDDLGLRFRTLSASEPRIAAYAPRLRAALGEYRAAVLRFFEARRLVDERVAGAERAKAVVVSQAAQLDDQIASSTLSARRTISAVMREAGAYMTAGSIGILVLIVGLTMLFIELNLRRPMAAVRAGIEGMRTDLDTRIALRRSDEWAMVEGALNRLAADLRASHDELREKNRALEETQRELRAKMVEVVAEGEARKGLEERLRHAQKMEAIGTLAGGVAHDFNNILSVVIGCASILDRDLEGRDASLRSCVEDILAASERAAVLTHDLLAFSRKQVIRLEAVEVNAVVRRVEKLLGRVLGEHIELSVVVADRELTVMADAVQLEQVLLNLSANARDAMPDGGRLTIRTERVDDGGPAAQGLEPGAYAAIAFSDTGVGMDPATRARVFEPFFTTKGMGKGTGLGLSMAYGIVKQHRGDIEVESAPGQGTRFRILFPIVDAAPAVEPGPPRPDAPPHRGTETILVAEDDPAVRRLIARVLSEFGYGVIEAVDGDDAVAKFAEHADRVKLAILDLVMPRKNGRQASEEIRRTRPEVQVLFSSGYTADLVSEEDVREEGVHFLPKPVAPEVLLAKVRQLLG